VTRTLPMAARPGGLPITDQLPQVVERLCEFGIRSPAGSFDVSDLQPLTGVRDGLADRVAAVLTDLPPGHLVVGALPFERTEAWLGRGPRTDPGLRRRTSRPTLLGIAEEPGSTFQRQVRVALDRIERVGDLQKVVLSRRIRLDFDRALDRSVLLATLTAQHPTAWSFGLAIADQNGGASWVGASPELLLRKRGRSIESVPLAGSAARPADRRADDRVRDALVTSTKDRREHAWVVEAIADTLAPYCRWLQVPCRPKPMSAGRLWHLGSRIVGELRDPDMSSIALVDQLHPTPALGGWPKTSALQAIAEIEGRPRGLYGGAVGWCDANGDGTWAVAIRCARVADRSMWAQAVAGIVAGSDPVAELAETTAKLGTILAAVDLANRR
jgi:isochorismate synthase